MRFVAEAIMRERILAALAVAILAVPGLFWVGAAAASLVLLRKGAVATFQIVYLGLVAGLVYWYFERPSPLLTLVGALLLAQVLRTTASWVKTLIASIIFGVFCSLYLHLYPVPEIQILAKLYEIQLPLVYEKFFKMSPEQIEQAMKGFSSMAVINVSLYATGIQFFCILSVIVARYFQSLLYNPGGFKEEFCQIRLPLGVGVVLFFLTFVAPSFGDKLAIMLFVAGFPLVIVGLAVVHGIIDKLNFPMGIVLFYIIFAFACYIVFPLLVILALVDSVFNLRKLPSLNSKSSDS